MKKRVSKLVYWTPRILSIAFILFLALFSFDVFDSGYTFWEIVLAFLMHNIPGFVMTAILIIAWKYEIVGGIAFVLAGFIYIGLLFSSQNFEWFMLSWSLIISGPAFLIGIFFFMNWFKKKREFPLLS